LAAKERNPDYLDKAWPLLRDAAAQQQQDPALNAAIAGVLAAAGRTQQAIEYYTRSLEQDPLQPDALRKLAALLGPSARATELLERARRLLPIPPLRD
jgi:tetratricopeptide (TPR) repeat protein